MTPLNEESGRSIVKSPKVQLEDPRTQETKPILHHHQRSVSFSASDSSFGSGLIDNDLPIEDKHEDEDVIELQTRPLSPEPGCSSPVWSFQGSSATQSPPIQTMSRPAGYDPNRIPVSIFSSKPHTEWSLASNESLFSIHLGNNSFSRDHVFLYSKSEEIPKYEDFISIPNTLSAGTDIPNSEIQTSQEEKQADIIEKLETTLTDVEDFEADRASEKINSEMTEISTQKLQTYTAKSSALDYTDENSTKLCGQSGLREKSTEHEKYAVKEIQEKPEEKITPREEIRETKCLSYRSESSTSTQSFNFPVLTADDGRGSSVTVESEQSGQLHPKQLPQQQWQSQENQQEEEWQPEKLENESPVELPKLARTSWLSWFTCRPFSCC